MSLSPHKEDQRAKSSREAVHFIDMKKFAHGGEILCGVALPTLQSEWRNRSTREPSNVTCKECVELLVNDGRLHRR